VHKERKTTKIRRRQLSWFVVLWEFHVDPKQRRAFEKAYGPRGEWARLFRTGKGYIRTQLIRDAEIPNRYLTLDYWKSLEHYERFKKQNRTTYQMIDKKCEALTVGETEIGRFNCLV